MKSASVRKPKTRKCAVATCRGVFEQKSMAHNFCSPECCEVLLSAKRAKEAVKARKLARVALAVRKEAAKTRSDYIKEAQHAFNAFIRERDKNQPCICCARETTTVSGLHAHGWDCGHYRSVGSAPHLRFNEANAHRQLVLCNRYGSGRAVDYRIGLIKRLGLVAVESLESDNTPAHWSIDDLKAIKATYKAKLKALLAEGKE